MGAIFNLIKEIKQLGKEHLSHTGSRCTGSRCSIVYHSPPIISGPGPENNGPPPLTLGPEVSLCRHAPYHIYKKGSHSQQ